MQRQVVEDIKGKTPLARPNFVGKQLQHSLLGAKARKPKTNSVR
jgi:hypothetical protein